MPMVEVNGTQLHYTDVGSGPRTVVFGHGLLWSGEMFGPQIEALSDRFRCVAVDWRGQGRSVVADAGYDMDTLTEDLVALIAHLGIAPVDYVGLSMGGFIGMRLAARHPGLVRSLSLLETSAEPEPAPNVPAYRKLAQVVRFVGPRPAAGRVMAIMFGQTFLTDPSRAVERIEWRRRLTSVDRVLRRALLRPPDRNAAQRDFARAMTAAFSAQTDPAGQAEPVLAFPVKVVERGVVGT